MKVFAALALALVAASFVDSCHGALQEGFYKGKCGIEDVEAIIGGVVMDRFFQDPTIVAALLRMQFHDCFVKGCDASILLDGSSSEKTAIPNLSVRGYDIIDDAKAAVEKLCPDLVSCADIIVAATRDAVHLAGGRRYEIETGRRDGLVSLASNVNLPSPTINVSQSIAAFAQKGLNTTDMVLLLGGHTVGVAHCSLFRDRLYNYQGTGQPDPTMDYRLLFKLMRICPRTPSNTTPDNTAYLDQTPQSAFVVDNGYFNQIRMGRGILQIDQELALDNLTKDEVKSLACASDFTTQFGAAMVNLGAVDVLTGTDGEIRKFCYATNGASS